jgi:hypothetical protein
MKLAVALFSIAGWVGEESFVSYTVTQDGPRTVYAGTAAFHVTSPIVMRCLHHDFDGEFATELGGPSHSANPGKPILPFDSVTQSENTVSVEWCIFHSEYQVLPYSVPRHFIFYSLKSEFGPEDLEKLLGDWGSVDSPWDLDFDGVVGGSDLTKLLAGWNGA